MTTAPSAGTDRRAELLERLRRKRRQEKQENDQITAEPWTGTAPLSSQQSGLWLAGELSNASYNMIILMRLRGPLDVGALRTALAGLISRHEGLRTSFAEQDGIPQMRVDPPPGRAWFEQLDLSAVPEPGRYQRAVQLVTDSCQQRIDLRYPPLLRVFLARLEDGDHLLGYVLHHIVGDGWS
ncbi:condensation domain-containing protein, partial [Jatrophihabitans sp.]|uniref:condensation domain-containing protein n=1 Tax=Jatrophihabitans sp. TaxID=1932789 RepID=UPI002EDD278A